MFDQSGEESVDPRQVDEMLARLAHIEASAGTVARKCSMCSDPILISVEEAEDRPEPSNWDMCRDCLEGLVEFGTDEQLEVLMNSR